MEAFHPYNKVILGFRRSQRRPQRPRSASGAVRRRRPRIPNPPRRLPHLAGVVRPPVDGRVQRPAHALRLARVLLRRGLYSRHDHTANFRGPYRTQRRGGKASKWKFPRLLVPFRLPNRPESDDVILRDIVDLDLDLLLQEELDYFISIQNRKLK